MNTKTHPLATPTKKFTTAKGTYRAKLETIRRREVRNMKKSFDRDRRSKG